MENIFTAEEKFEIEQVFGGSPDSSGKELSFYFYFEKNLKKWSLLATQCKEGYAYGVNDFISDLFMRVSLEDVMTKFSKSLKDKVRDILNDMDKEYFASTNKSNIPLFAFDEKDNKLELKIFSRVPKNIKETERELWLDALVAGVDLNEVKWVK